MRTPVALHIATDADAKPESVAQRVRRLQAEAREQANAHIDAVASDLEAAADQAREIAAGGEAYPDGVRQIYAQLAREIDSRLLSIRAIRGRVL